MRSDFWIYARQVRACIEDSGAFTEDPMVHVMTLEQLPNARYRDVGDDHSNRAFVAHDLGDRLDQTLIDAASGAQLEFPAVPPYASFTVAPLQPS